MDRTSWRSEVVSEALRPQQNKAEKVPSRKLLKRAFVAGL